VKFLKKLLAVLVILFIILGVIAVDHNFLKLLFSVVGWFMVYLLLENTK